MPNGPVAVNDLQASWINVQCLTLPPVNLLAPYELREKNLMGHRLIHPNRLGVSHQSPCEAARSRCYCTEGDLRIVEDDQEGPAPQIDVCADEVVSLERSPPGA